MPIDMLAEQQPRLVLYIEDNLANLALLEAMLARSGNLRLISAGTGREGVVLANTRQPDVILMDINLPDMSGMEALKYLQDHVETAHIPVMALSSNAFPQQIEQGLAAGFFRYLTKPFKIAEFNQALAECLAFTPTPMYLAQVAAFSAPAGLELLADSALHQQESVP